MGPISEVANIIYPYYCGEVPGKYPGQCQC